MNLFSFFHLKLLDRLWWCSAFSQVCQLDLLSPSIYRTVWNSHGQTVAQHWFIWNNCSIYFPVVFNDGYHTQINLPYFISQRQSILLVRKQEIKQTNFMCCNSFLPQSLNIYRFNTQCHWAEGLSYSWTLDMGCNHYNIFYNHFYCSPTHAILHTKTHTVILNNILYVYIATYMHTHPYWLANK